MADIAKKTKRYPTDLTDEELSRIESLLPRSPKRGRRRSVDLREILNAIRYMARSGGGWRMLPKDFSPWQTVYWWFRPLRAAALVPHHPRHCLDDRPGAVRTGGEPHGGRHRQPVGEGAGGQGTRRSLSSGGPPARPGGPPARRCSAASGIAVDTDGRLLMVNLTTADISDSTGAQMILAAIRKRWPWLKHLFADGAYDRTQLMGKAAFLDFVIEIVRRIDDEPGCKVLPRRWAPPAAFAIAVGAEPKDTDGANVERLNRECPPAERPR